MKKKLISLFLCAVMCLGAISGLTACKKNGGEGDEGDSKGKSEYTVTVKSAGGMAMSEIDVYVYADDSLEEMTDFAKTGDDGKVNFKLEKSDKYAIVLSGMPKGYDVKKSYAFDGNAALITVKSALITEEDLSTATLELGDVMYDFTVMKASDGKEITLSDVLKEKDCVVLNFWYTTCTWCVEEFPLMNEVYSEYKDKVEVIALNPMEDNTAVKPFQEQYQLDFPMAACPASWANTFGISGYPTSVIVDRYGVICLIESGAIISKRPWVCAFDHFTADKYNQKLCVGGIGDLVTQIKPNVEMPASEDIAAAVNKGTVNVTYRPETEDKNAEYIWPFIKAEKLGQECIMASNKGIDDSSAIIYADVELKAGQALGFDYLASSEQLCDILYIIVDGEDVYQISGTSDKEEWNSCYPVVADKDGTYEVALCYAKDSDGAEGDDTVYIDNVRIVDKKDIDVATYLPRFAATENEDGETFTYASIFFNEKDNYYHVGSENGPLLLVDLMNYTAFNEEKTIQELVYAGNADKDGVSLYNKKEDGGLGMVSYFVYASNSSLPGICTVNRELGDMLKQVADLAGFTEDPNEWLKACKYFVAYGPGTTQLQDPIKGVTTFSAYTATLGKNVESNYFYYDRPIIPRGLLAKFVPTQTGVYRFTSKSDYQEGIDAWVFDKDGNQIYTYERDERTFDDDINCSIVYYMKAGEAYYINMAFWDVYATGYIHYDVEYLGATYNLFRLCSPGYFTYDSNATGDQIYDIVAGGITPVLKDGKYYEKEGSSPIYCDFTGSTGIFDQSIQQMIELGGFDFSKSETDDEILAYLRQNGNDPEKTKKYLKTLWGDDYDASYDFYQVDDVLEGRYHGDGPDLTAEMRKYVSQMDKSGTERDGCVIVDERLAEMLQLLLDKYTFEDVENTWIKVCYYYDYLGK